MPSFTVPGEENEYKQVPSGIQLLEVIKAVDAKSGEGKEQIILTLQAENGGTLRDWLTFTTAAAFKIKEFIEAGTGKKLTKDQNMDLETDDCLNMKPVWAIVVTDDQKPQYKRVKKYLTKEQAAELLNQSANAESEDEIPF